MSQLSVDGVMCWPGQGVLVMTAAAYVARHHASNTVMLDLLDSLTQTRQQMPQPGISPSKRAAYPAHLRAAALEASISEGSVLQVGALPLSCMQMIF